MVASVMGAVGVRVGIEPLLHDHIYVHGSHYNVWSKFCYLLIVIRVSIAVIGWDTPSIPSDF